MFSLKKKKKEKSIKKQIEEDMINKLADVFDFDYKISEQRIESVEAFQEKILEPFDENQKIFYRGERVYDVQRRLLPTLLRDAEDEFIDSDDLAIMMDCYFLKNQYESRMPFARVYKNTMGSFDIDNMYEMLAFAQHYLGDSPMIDFTKSLYVALSFGLKNRRTAEQDMVLYTAEIINDEDYTQDIAVANRWLRDYRVTVLRDSDEIKEMIKKGSFSFIQQKIRSIKDEVSEHDVIRPQPTPKLIDIPTNDLMKYQQGVFLLLTNFSIMNGAYLTKSIRRNFSITKYIISCELFGYLLDLIEKRAPFYKYEYLMNIPAALQNGSQQL